MYLSNGTYSDISNTSTSTYGSITCGVMRDYSSTDKKYGIMTAGLISAIKGGANGNMVYVDMTNIESAFDLKAFNHR